MIQCRYVCRLNTVKKSEEQLPREKKLVRDVQLTKKDYTKLFQDNLITFLKPLTVQKGYLTYTAGFARTVANL